MAYVPPPAGSTVLGQPTPAGVPKQDAHIADLPPEVRRSFLLSMVFFPTIVGAMVCLILFLGYFVVFKPKDAVQYGAELGSADARRRWVAARELSENIGNPRIYNSQTLTTLIGILENPDLDKEVSTWTPSSAIKDPDEKNSRLRWWAAPMVGHFGGVLADPADKERAMNALLKALDDKNLTVFAARGLCLMKDARAKDGLIKHLSDEDAGARAACANALGAIGSYLLSSKAAEGDVESFRTPLRSAFAVNQDANVLDNIAIALARMKEPLGKDRLVTLSKSEDAVARDNARRALEILNQPSL
jgi:hypothetical protein